MVDWAKQVAKMEANRVQTQADVDAAVAKYLAREQAKQAFHQLLVWTFCQGCTDILGGMAKFGYNACIEDLRAEVENG